MAKPMLPNATIQWSFSASPNKLTDPQTHTKVWIPSQPFDFLEILQRRMHLILYYKKHNDADSAAWHVEGWIKEALGNALIEQPILAGRLRKSAHGGLEIVSNDSGIRCVAAQTSLSLIEFLESNDRHKVEHEFVHWYNDAYEESFQYSPLFYIQVTNFQCGGYAIGISCSLLLADPLRMAKLIRKWAENHRCVAFHGDVPKTPEFYNPYLKQPKCPLPIITTPKNYKRDTSKFTMYMFHIDTDENFYFGDEMYMYFVLLCIEEAETKAGQTMNSNFALVTKVPNGDIKVETSTKKAISRDPKSMTYGLRGTSLEDLGTNKISFQKDNAPVDVSHWVACDSHEGTVLVVMASPHNGMSVMNVYVTFPNPES